MTTLKPSKPQPIEYRAEELEIGLRTVTWTRAPGTIRFSNGRTSNRYSNLIREVRVKRVYVYVTYDNGVSVRFNRSELVEVAS